MDYDFAAKVVLLVTNGSKKSPDCFTYSKSSTSRKIKQYTIMTDSKLVTFQISSEGKVIDSSIQVAEIEVYHNVSGIAQARMILLAGDNVPQLVDSPAFETGKRLEIKLGYDQADQSIFAGIIASQNLYVEPGQGAAFEVICEALTEIKTTSLADLQKLKPMEVLTYGDNILACNIQSDPQGDGQAEGAFKVFGNSVLVAGGVVAIYGLGKAFQGNHFLSSVSHHVANGQWVTDINIGGMDEEAQ